MTLTGRTKLLLYAAGTVLLLLSLYYVGSRIAENWALVRRTEIRSLPWLFACIASYAACHLTNGLSWPFAVRQLGGHISFLDGIRIGLVAQIGKYLPGNIAHYVGRGALATEHGVTLQSSGISTLIELASAMSAMVIVAIAGLSIDSRPVDWLPKTSIPPLWFALAILAALLGGWVWMTRRGTHLGLLAAPTLCIGGSFILAGISVYALAHSLGLVGLSLAAAISAFALAWGAGFLVPGAPAGLGIREAALLALLSPLVGGSGAIAITLAHRVMTAIVDACAAVAGYSWMAAGSRSKK